MYSENAQVETTKPSFKIIIEAISSSFGATTSDFRDEMSFFVLQAFVQCDPFVDALGQGDNLHPPPSWLTKSFPYLDFQTSQLLIQFYCNKNFKLTCAHTLHESCKCIWSKYPYLLVGVVHELPNFDPISVEIDKPHYNYKDNSPYISLKWQVTPPPLNVDGWATMSFSLQGVEVFGLPMLMFNHLIFYYTQCHWQWQLPQYRSDMWCLGGDVGCKVVVNLACPPPPNCKGLGHACPSR